MPRCCDCVFFLPQALCRVTDDMIPMGDKNREHDCNYWQQATPPLVDALAEALYWLLNLHHNVSKAGNDPETGQPYPVTDEEWKAAIDEGMRVHARYQEEMGDAEA